MTIIFEAPGKVALEREMEDVYCPSYNQPLGCYEWRCPGGLHDIQFPYTESRLPASFKRITFREKCIDTQALVWAKAKNIEDINEGRHRHFGIFARPEPYSYPEAGLTFRIRATNVDTCFKARRLLGGGGYGYVDCVLSSLSIRKYAALDVLVGTNFQVWCICVAATVSQIE
jgi:hypothetical protein